MSGYNLDSLLLEHGFDVARPLGYPNIKHLPAFLGRGPLRARDVLVQRLAGTGAEVEPTASQQTAVAAACAMIAR